MMSADFEYRFEGEDYKAHAHEELGRFNCYALRGELCLMASFYVELTTIGDQAEFFKRWHEAAGAELKDAADARNAEKD